MTKTEKQFKAAALAAVEEINELIVDGNNHVLECIGGYHTVWLGKYDPYIDIILRHLRPLVAVIDPLCVSCGDSNPDILKIGLLCFCTCRSCQFRWTQLWIINRESAHE